MACCTLSCAVFYSCSLTIAIIIASCRYATVTASQYFSNSQRISRRERPSPSTSSSRATKPGG